MHRHLKTSTILTALFAVLLVVSCGRNPTPTPTRIAPPTELPTELPPAPTAPPLTAVPTPVLPTATPPLPPATTAVPSPEPSTPTATATIGIPTVTPLAPVSNASTGGGAAATPVPQGPLTGLSISNLRYEPSYPQKLEPVNFYATLVNRTGKDQNYPICAEIFRPGAAKSFGITNCDTVTIVPGTAEVFIGSWIASGIKECIPVRARAVLREKGEGEARLVVPPVNGGELWVDFNMCP